MANGKNGYLFIVILEIRRLAVSLAKLGLVTALKFLPVGVKNWMGDQPRISS